MTATSDGGCTPSSASVTVTVNKQLANLPPDNPSENRERNWTLERSFDGDGNEVAASKQFTDGLGRPTQAQARNAATQQVFAAQTIYNSGGQPVLQTLAAPTYNQSFNYKDNFITATVNGQSTAYGPANFEQGNAANPTPLEATTVGTLGYYYSKQNTQEPLTPLTSYPYSLVEPYDGPLGGTKRAAGPGEAFRMGNGREAKGREFLVRKEFDQYLTLRPTFITGSPPVTMQYQAVKSVSVNADGRESIAVTNKDGQTLLTCLSGAQYPAIPVFGYLSSESTNPYDADAPIFADVHIPAVGSQQVTFTMGKATTTDGKIRIVNLLTDETTDYALTVTNVGVTEPTLHVTLAPGFYRFISVSGTQWSYYEAHYGNFSYTYYDDAGRVVATVAPNGLADPAAVTAATATNPLPFTTRNTYDTTGHLLTTESPDEGRSEYVYAQDGRIRFSQSALQRPAGRFSYSHYDEVGRVVESGEYTPATSPSSPGQSPPVSQRFQSPQYGAWDGAVATTNGVVYPNSCVGSLDAVGKYVEFTVQAPQAGAYTLTLNYASGNPNRTLTLLVNGNQPTQLTFPRTDNYQWDTYLNTTTPVTLQAGTNVLRLEYRPGDSGGVNPAYIQFSGSTTTTTASSGNLIEERFPTNSLDVTRCAQRNQVWYDLAFDGTAGSQGNDSQLSGRHQEFLVGAVAKTQNDNVTTWYSYDELGRVTWVVQNIKGVGVKTLDYQYDFSGNVLQVAYQKGQADSFYHYYGYDAAQRLTTVTTSPDGTSRTLQAEYSYYLHGPLKRVQVAGNLQGVDYVYTLQGALKSINHANQTLEPGHDAPKTNGVYKDLFALTLEYFSGDYASQAIDVPAPPLPPVPGAPVADRFDGTIRSASWRTGASADVQRMAYIYDEKSQLKNSTYSNWQLLNSAYQLNAASTNRFQEGGLDYDPNGNMLSLQRTGATGNVTDNFSYVYKPKTNQLQGVHTGSAGGATVLDYDYDELGQMTRQKDEQGDRYFTYDVTGKTTGAYLDKDHQQPLVTFAYDDRGFRVSKTAYPPGGVAAQTTYYVRDVAGNILTVYSQPTPGGGMQRSEVPLYGASRLGSLTHLADGTATGTDDYRYELNDHLGDARVVFHRPSTQVDVETMELSGVPSRAAFLNDDQYRVAVSGAPSGEYVARLTDSQPAGQELKRVLTVTRGDTVTFSALAQWKQNAAAGGSSATPYVLLGAAAGLNGLSQRGVDGQTTYSTTNSNWFSLLAAGLGFTIGQGAPASLGATSLEGWIKYRVLDAQGIPMLDAQGQEIKGIDYLLGTGKWEYLQTGVRVPQDGTIEVTAGTSGTGEAVYFDNLRVEQTGGLIVQEQHQYAFGAPLPGLSYTVGTKRYRYGYQGQYAEHDDETGFESFELRLYNSRVGRWMSYDPEGQFDSPYVGMGNNPVSGVDPDGGFSGPPGMKYLTGTRLNSFGGSFLGSTARTGMSSGLRTFLQTASSAMRAANSRAVSEARMQAHVAAQDGTALPRRDVRQPAAKPVTFPSYSIGPQQPTWQNDLDVGAANGLEYAGFVEAPYTLAKTALSLYKIAKGVKPVLSSIKAAKAMLMPLGRGNTGRILAATLEEQLAMQEVLMNPQLAEPVMAAMSDARWAGWRKMQYVHRGFRADANGNMVQYKVTVHFVAEFQNGIMTAVDDFKFK